LQRVAIARAIVMRPRLLLADEPTGNLDSHSGGEVIDVLEKLNQEGITLITVTHDQKLGDRARRHIRLVDGLIDSDHSALINSEKSDYETL
jgi:putative ABC transport system ATP-binding protein